MQYTDADILLVMRGLGITQSELSRARRNAEALEELKARIKKTYRKLVQDLHPDKTGNDPDKAKLFQLATHVVKEINNMKARTAIKHQMKWAIDFRVVRKQ